MAISPKMFLSIITLLIYFNLQAQELADSGVSSIHPAEIKLQVDSTNYEQLLSRMLDASQQQLELKKQNFQQEIELLDARNQLLHQNQQSQVKFIWAGSIFFLIISMLLYYLYYTKQKTNRKLREIDRLKAQLFADISHEFRTPLSLIKSPVQMLLQRSDLSPDLHDKLAMIHRHAGKLNQLVNSVNDLTKLESNKMQLAVCRMDLTNQLKTIVASFEGFAAVKNLSLETSFDLPNQDYYYDPTHIESIIYNLISNAIKFTNRGGVTIEARLDGKEAKIVVIDTGIGLSTADQAKVFNRYFRAEGSRNNADGIGLGLALSHQLAKLQRGMLQVYSQDGQGSTFTLSFPITLAGYKKEELNIGSGIYKVTPQVEFSRASMPVHEINAITDDEPLLLIVEDNADMRFHLAEIFQKDYRILPAENGQVGLELARVLVPDLIISDLMMPVMDGQALLKAVKTDTTTSHIPFIMLTANHLEEEKLKGLQHRVDDYMTKPFSLEEIKLKVNNLIHLREQLRLKYQNANDDSTPVIRHINETEEQFWTQLNEVVQDNLDNADFSADDFAKAMFMSRMQLHRKLKALTSLSTTLFLRTERLKEAKKMLQKPDAIVANVAYDVGFSSPSFFSKCFKEQYGVTPKKAQAS